MKVKDQKTKNTAVFSSSGGSPVRLRSMYSSRTCAVAEITRRDPVTSTSCDAICGTGTLGPPAWITGARKLDMVASIQSCATNSTSLYHKRLTSVSHETGSRLSIRVHRRSEKCPSQPPMELSESPAMSNKIGNNASCAGTVTVVVLAKICDEWSRWVRSSRGLLGRLEFLDPGCTRQSRSREEWYPGADCTTSCPEHTMLSLTARVEDKTDVRGQLE